MANTPYDNFYLSNEIEDQYKSHLDLTPFCTVDNTLEGTAGMKRIIHVYKATDGVEKLSQGKGNTKSIGASYTEEEHEIILAQGKFEYFDEEAMKDPMIVTVGTKHLGTDLFNTVNADIFAAFNTANLEVTPTKLDFGAFADAVALLNIDGTDNDPKEAQVFAFVCPQDMAAIRKNLGEELKYVESFARAGYVGTVAGVNLYTKKDAVHNTVILGTKGAVTLFNKKGTEVEQLRDPDTRKNDVFGRKYYLAALTDATKAVKITIA